MNRIFLLIFLGLTVFTIDQAFLASEDYTPASKAAFTVTSLTVEPPNGSGPASAQLEHGSPYRTKDPYGLAFYRSYFPLETLFVKATYYHDKFLGRRTANGEIYDPFSYTCAHRTLPFNTILRVTNGERTVIVRVNDRGPFRRGKSLDLSYVAARDLGMLEDGVKLVRVEILDTDFTASR